VRWGDRGKRSRVCVCVCARAHTRACVCVQGMQPRAFSRAGHTLPSHSYLDAQQAGHQQEVAALVKQRVGHGHLRACVWFLLTWR
jgi:hypothetical protein